MMATILLWLSILTGAQTGVAEAWGPATQAQWPATTARPFKVELRPVARRIRFDGAFDATVVVAGTNGAGVNPLFGSGRGLFLKVTDRSGAAVAGATAISIPPPPPPVPAAGLSRPTAAKPLVVRYSEPAQALFPAAGRYTVRSVMTVYDMSSKRYLRAESKPVAIVVE